MGNYLSSTDMVKFVIHEYMYGYNKVSTGKFFVDISYSYPLPNDYMTCRPPRFNALSQKFLFFYFHSGHVVWC